MIEQLLNPELIYRHRKAQQDFFWFCTEVLGYKSNEFYKDYRDLCQKHRELTAFISGEGSHKLVLCPRYSVKSSIVTVGYSLWRMVKDPNIRILIYSENATKARAFLTDIKNHILGRAPNSKFREMYPGWESDPREDKWTEEKIVISSRKVSLREPTVDTAGIETGKVGVHCDLLIHDDIVSDVNATTKVQMDKVFECYKKSLSLLKPDGEVILVGTRWSYGDAYGRIIDENPGKGNLFKLFITDAEAENPDGTLLYESIGLTREFLNRQKSEQGTYLYSSLYRNEPANADTCLFRIENFRFYEYVPGFEKNMYITGALDPAGEGDDYSAFTVCATDFKKNIYILDAVNRRMMPHELVNEVIRLNYKWGFDRFVVEKNFFKGMLEKEFREVEKEHIGKPGFKQFGFSEDLVTSVAQKSWTRVLSLQPVHERGQLYFPGKSVNTLPKPYSDLADQMMQFTVDGSKSAHDDLLMSLSFHLSIILPGGEAETGYIPENSVAWYERQWVEEHNAMQRRLPRQKRTYLETSLS